MTDEQIKEIIASFETLTLTNVITDSQSATITLRSYIGNQLKNGIDPAVIKANLINDLKNGGQLFGSFRKAIRTRVFNGIEKTADAGIQVEQEERGVELYEWSNIADEKTCGDCMDRGNEPANTYAYWESKGLPGTGATICGMNCRCDIVATGIFTKEMKDEASARYYTEKYNATHDKQITLEDARKKIGVAQGDNAVKFEANEIIFRNEAKNYTNYKAFEDAQTTLYRGGTAESKYMSVSKNIAEDYAKYRGGDVKEYVISPKSKVVEYSKFPDAKYKGINDYNIEKYSMGEERFKFFEGTLEKDYILAEKWAKSNGYDIIKFDTEGEMRILNKNAIVLKSKLKDIFGSIKK